MNPECHQAFLRMEQRQLIEGFKFGILYAEEGQTKEDEIFSNGFFFSFSLSFLFNLFLFQSKEARSLKSFWIFSVNASLSKTGQTFVAAWTSNVL